MRQSLLIPLLLAPLLQLSAFATSPSQIDLNQNFSELDPDQQALFWKWREEFSILSEELAQPLGQLTPQRRASIFRTLEAEIATSQEPLRQLGATLALFYTHKGPQRELRGLLNELIFSKAIPLQVRWVSAAIWVSQGGPHLARSQRKELDRILQAGIHSLAREVSTLPKDPIELDTRSKPYTLSTAALWLLDDPWLKWLSPGKVPRLSFTAHLELAHLNRFVSAVQDYRRWKAQLRETITPAHQSLCARELLTDISPSDTREQRDPFSRR